MTTHDEPDLQLLERDLRALAEPRPADELLRIAMRGELTSRLRPGPRRRLSMRIAAGSAALGAVAAALAALALVGTNGTGEPSAADAAIIHHALRAVSPPPNEILHVRLVGVQNGVTVVAETWRQTSRPYAFRVAKGEAGHQGEFADNGKTSFVYDPGTNTVSESPGPRSPAFADPIWQVRQELASGRAQLAGTVVIHGTALYKIDLPHGLVGFFAERNYHPWYLDDPQRDGSVIRLRVAAYEYLPMTPTNRALLSVTAQHPAARIERSAGGGAK
ncbi:MAG TPA: hypothetical protein VKR21_04565 [Solirubrobacteraceae bacterium]|nr:hypothetical protein [Solirubrobacteraceae bacterium]